MQYNWLIIWFIVIFCIILPQKKRRKRRRNLLTFKERAMKMNELIKSMIGKHVEIAGDLYLSGIGRILSSKDGWIEFETDSGKKMLMNTIYISKISEVPEKKKKN